MEDMKKNLKERKNLKNHLKNGGFGSRKERKKYWKIAEKTKKKKKNERMKYLTERQKNK